MAQKDNPYLTITLTGRAPVKIKKEEWPVIASAADTDFDGQYDFQANRKAEWSLAVRQHRDGRTIVYGKWQYQSKFQNEADGEVRGGELITVTGADAEVVGDTEPIIAAIQRVAEDLEARIDVEGRYGEGRFARLAHECVADLPAVEL